MSRQAILILISFGLLQIFFQNCGIRMQTFTAVESAESKSSSTPDSSNPTPNLIDLVAPAEPNDLQPVAKINNLDNIGFDIPDTLTKNIYVDLDLLKQSVESKVPVYQEIVVPGLRVKREKSFSMSKLKVEIGISLIKAMVTSDSVAFPGGGFGDLTIAYKAVSKLHPVKFEVVLSNAEEFSVNLHDLRLDLSGFLMGEELKYGTAFYKIDYSFPEINYEKSTILALHVYKKGTEVESQISLESGSETLSNDLETVLVCKTNGAQLVTWASENSSDECRANFSGQVGQMRPYGWHTTDYLKVGQSLTLRGGNSLKFLSSGSATTQGTAELKCTPSGWVLENKTCRNSFTIDNSEKANRLTFDYNQGPKFIKFFVDSLKHE